MRIALGIFAVLCNFLMDEIQFHWDRFFGTIIDAGSKLAQWFNPDLSWVNKPLRYFESDFLTLIFSTVLVWTTDFWHLLKFLMLTSIFLLVLLLVEKGRKWWQYILMIIFLHLCWGLVFELFNGIFNII